MKERTWSALLSFSVICIIFHARIITRGALHKFIRGSHITKLMPGSLSLGFFRDLNESIGSFHIFRAATLDLDNPIGITRRARLHIITCQFRNTQYRNHSYREKIRENIWYFHLILSLRHRKLMQYTFVYFRSISRISERFTRMKIHRAR